MSTVVVNRKRPPRWLYPEAAERAYLRLMRDIMKNYRQRFDSPAVMESRLTVPLQNIVDIASQVNEFNKTQWQKIAHSMLGVDAFYEPWLEEQLALFVRENVLLIKKATNPATIEEATIRGFRQGKRASAIASDIQGALDRTQRQLELIARDQISKLNGELTKLRQTSAGISSYIWRTSLDERVREEHRQREGSTFEWKDFPEDGHPGFPINCRCWAEMVD